MKRYVPLVIAYIITAALCGWVAEAIAADHGAFAFLGILVGGPLGMAVSYGLDRLRR